MKHYLVAVGWGLALAAAAWGQTVPLYINNSGVTNTVDTPLLIDATSFENRAEIYTLTTYAFDTQNTLYYTNRNGGVMTGYVGFAFEHVTNGNRYPAARFVNQGIIHGESVLTVQATNIINSGRLSVGASGLLTLEGGSIDLKRGGLRSGAVPGTYYGGGRNMRTNYYNAPGITDIYWGAGRDDAMDTNGTPLDLMPYYYTNVYYTNYYFYDQNFDVPYTRSPYHEVETFLLGTTYYTTLYTNLVQLPSYYYGYGTYYGFGYGSYGQYDAFVYTNQLTATSDIVQVVFVPTNIVNTNLSVQVRFSGATLYGSGLATVPIVEFSSTDFDVVLQTTVTNYVYLLDYAAQLTNIVLLSYNNALTTVPIRTRRPNAYEVVRDTPYEWYYAGTTNARLTNTLFYNTNYLTNVVHLMYGAYAVQVEPVLTLNPFTDPMQAPGAVKINAGQLDLSQTRIRADQLLSIATTNLVGNQLAAVDAPTLNYDLGTTNAVLEVSNLVGNTAKRLVGPLAAWSGVWTNRYRQTQTNIVLGTNGWQTNIVTVTNFTKFHVLVVDHALRSEHPVTLDEFKVHATNVVLHDPLTVQRTLLVDADNFELRNGSAIFLPPGANWAPTNFPRLKNLTNQGNIILSGFGGFYGASNTTELPYANWINSGLITGATHLVRALNAVNSGVLAAESGIISFQTGRLTLTNGQVKSRSDIEVYGNELAARGSRLTAGGAVPGGLILSVTNRLDDGGPTASNEWLVTAGFQLARRPAGGDLLGTRLVSQALENYEAIHVWAGEDRGPNAAGFVNNAALGRLVLDGTNYTLFSFSGTGASNGLYVDYLELCNNATNYNTALQIAPNLTIYFANANLSADKLNGALNGRLRWVPGYLGALSTTNFPSTTNLLSAGLRSNAMNLALALSRELDSDGDGIANYLDPMPLFSDDDVNMAIGLTNRAPRRPLLVWRALAGSTSYVEFLPALNSTQWTTLATLVQGVATGPLAVELTPGTNRARFLRVRQVFAPPVAPVR